MKATVDERRMNQVPPMTLLNAEKSVLVGMMLAIKKIKQVNRLTTTAKMDNLVEALGPKCLVTISIDKKETHETRIPPSMAMISF